MMPGSVVPVIVRAAFAVIAFSVPLGATSFGFFFGFFGFDFLAEFFVFGVFCFAAFAFVVDFFDRHQFVVPLVVRFGFVVVDDDEVRRGWGDRFGVGRGGRGEQHQRSEQEDQQ